MTIIKNTHHENKPFRMFWLEWPAYVPLIPYGVFYNWTFTKVYAVFLIFMLILGVKEISLASVIAKAWAFTKGRRCHARLKKHR